MKRSHATILAALSLSGMITDGPAASADEAAILALTSVEVAGVDRIVFCSGHPSVTADDLRRALTDRGLDRIAVVADPRSERPTNVRTTYYVAIADADPDAALDACLRTFPDGFQDAVTDAVGQLMQPLPEALARLVPSGLILGTGRTLRGDDWIGKAYAFAYEGENARVDAIEIILPSR